MFPNGSTKLRARERDATERSQHARLARLIASPAERQYQFESGDALPPSATVTPQRRHRAAPSGPKLCGA